MKVETGFRFDLVVINALHEVETTDELDLLVLQSFSK